MLIGDAAGFIDPFTGEGIFRALRSARAAAEALEAGDDGRGRPLPRRPARGLRRQGRPDLAGPGMLAAPPVMGYAIRRLAAPPRGRQAGSALGDLRPPPTPCRRSSWRRSWPWPTTP